MEALRIRCSSLGDIMTEPRTKGAGLSQTAKSHIEDLAKMYVYNYSGSFSSRETQKGLIVENESINLLNEVLFTSYTKNTERRSNQWITGECDIDTSRRIHDIKSSWSLKTFPATVNDGQDKGYEWQVRGYMMLWDRDSAEVDYCLVDTPDELIGYEDESLHKVSHIDPMLRVTRVCYERDRTLEDRIREKVEAAQKYFLEVIETIYKQHK